jgi:hypothetical protein
MQQQQQQQQQLELLQVMLRAATALCNLTLPNMCWQASALNTMFSNTAIQALESLASLAACFWHIC